MRPVDDELLNRLRRVRDVLRRTSDPLDEPFGLHFEPASGWSCLDAWREDVRYRRAHGNVRTAVVYAHVPYCMARCSYCVFYSGKPGSSAELDAYVEAFSREAALWGEANDGVPISTIHVGGGTPSILTEGQIERLLGSLRTAFPVVTDAFRFGMEFHPSTATRGRLAAAARCGVDRVSLGVQSFDAAVLASVNRDSRSPGRVHEAIAHARSVGIRAVNLDLLAGLPGQTHESFLDSVRQAIGLDIDALSVNRFLSEDSGLARLGYVPDAMQVDRADRMLAAVDPLVRSVRPPLLPERPVGSPGYGIHYVWSRPETSRTYFQEDMVGAVPSIGIGCGAMGHLPNRFFWRCGGHPAEYVRALESGDKTAYAVARVHPRFDAAYQATDLVCRGRYSDDRLRAHIGEETASGIVRDIAGLVGAGLLVREREAVRKGAHRGFGPLHLMAFLMLSPQELDESLGRIARSASATGGSRRDRIREYDLIGEEFPLSLLWCRIGLKAAAAGQAGAIGPVGQVPS